MGGQLVLRDWPVKAAPQHATRETCGICTHHFRNGRRKCNGRRIKKSIGLAEWLTQATGLHREPLKTRHTHSCTQHTQYEDADTKGPDFRMFQKEEGVFRLTVGELRDWFPWHYTQTCLLPSHSTLLQYEYPKRKHDLSSSLGRSKCVVLLPSKLATLFDT